MAKAFKGQFAKSQTVNTQSEFISGREAVTVLGTEARFVPSINAQNVAADSSAYSLTDEGLYTDDSSTKVEGDGIGLHCPTGKELMLRYVSQHGDSYADAESTLLRGLSGSEIADEINPSMAVGGSFSGVIDFDGDVDDITVFLVAGQIYLISLRGTGADPLFDSFIRVFNPAANGGAQLAVDDDGGNDLNSFVTFAAAFTGQHTIRATSFDNNPNALNLDTGSYTVDVRVRGVDAIGDTNATSVPLSLGTTFGHRETGTGANNNPQNLAGNAFGYPAGTFNGDTDRYSVTLEAGHFYTFKVAGGWDANPGAENDTAIALYNSTGTAAGVLAINDDVNGGAGDFSSALGFYAETSGTYYFDVFAYANQNAGYIIEFEDVDFASQDPRDAFNWFSADNVDFVDVNGVPTAYVYFALPGESFGELADNNVDPLPSFGWNAREIQQVMLALESFEHILGVNYEITTDINQATFRLITTTSEQYGAYFYPQDPAFGTQQGIGAFNVDSGNWDKPGASEFDTPGDQVSLDRGGYAFSVILHEFGHAHGLAHPHDNGGGSDVLLGVTGATGSYGIFNLNQGVYSVMSYNDAWDFHPDGPTPFTLAGLDNGWTGSLTAFDIATLQQRYGVKAYNGGDNVYTIIDVVDDAFYECIWDSGGTDAIVYGGTLNANIDLLAATIDYSPTGGGPISFVIDPAPGTSPLRGGFTIAQGAVIENATGGSGNDNLIGNSAANVLTGNDGADNFVGRAGDDTLHGGAGTDTAYYDGNRADYTINAIITNGVITGFTVKDDNIAAPANSNNPVVVANEGTDTLDGVESLDFADALFSLSGAVAVFDGDGDLVSVHSTIQAAIDAATTLDGYTVFASAGTYAEDVNVTKDLTIQGANDGVAGDDVGRIAETSVKSFTISANGVTIDGVEVTGISATAGVYVGGDNFSLVNSVLDGPAAGVGINTENVQGLEVASNLITGYGQGAYVSGGSTTGSFHDNAFEGDGPGSGTGTQNGILSESTLMLIENNTFDGIDGGSIYALPQGPADTVDLLDIIIGNIISNSGAARPIQIYPSTFTPNVLGTDENEAFVGDWGGLGGVDLSFDGRGGADHIYGDSGDDTFTGGADNDLLVGGAGTDTGVFDDAAVSYADTAIGWLVSSSEGNDFLQQMEVVEADGQRNLLVGATGYANLQAALTAAETGDNVRLAAGTYSGTVNYSVDGLTVFAQPNAVQNLTYATASAFGITVHGANGADSITGSANNDTLFGGGGIDTLNGGAGNDTLHGEAGSDVLSGGLGDDTYYIGDGVDQVVEATGSGFDLVFSTTSYGLAGGTEIEVLSTNDWTSTAAINLTGNEFVNIVYGNAGANELNGGGGRDILIGFGGDDRYFVDDLTEVVIEGAGNGFDSVFASASYILTDGASVEVLSVIDFLATTAINLTGNELANIVYGNAGDNILNGASGADLLISFGGADLFAFSTALGGGNIDTVYDFVIGADKIGLDDAIFTAITTLDMDAFFIGTAAADAEDRIIYDSTTGQLFYDSDGVGGTDAIQFANIAPGLALTVSDFQMI